MADVKTLQGNIKLRKDTEANWMAQDPFLLDGEKAVVVTDDGTIRHKTGNGTHTYNNLPFDDEPIYEAIKQVANKKEVNFIIRTSDWNAETGTATITLGGMGIDATTTGVASLPQTISDEQYDAVALSGMYISSQGENTVTFRCRQGIPKIDIPIYMIVF